MPNDNPVILNNPVNDYQETTDQQSEFVIDDRLELKRSMLLSNNSKIVLPDDVKVVDRKKDKKN